MNNNETLKKVMTQFLAESQKFVSLRDRKARKSWMTEEEKKAFENSKNVITEYGRKIKALNISQKEVAETMLSTISEVNSRDEKPRFVERDLTVGEATVILNQFLNAEDFVRNSPAVREHSLQIVRNSHIANILAKYAPFYGDHEKVFEQEEKLEKMIGEFRDKYISPEVVELGIAFASEYFNKNELEQYGQPVDASFVTALVLEQEHDENAESDEGAKD